MAKRERGEGGVFKVAGSRNWRVQYQDVTGRQVRVSSGTPIKQKAIAYLRKLMGERDEGLAPVTDVRRLRYADLRTLLIDWYKKKGRKSLKKKKDGSEYITGLTVLDDFCGFKQEIIDGKFVVTEKGVPVTALTTDFASRFVRKRLEEGTGNAAINRSLAALRKMFNLAKKKRKISVVPSIEFQDEPKARKGFLEQPKFEELVKLLPTGLRPLVTFLYYCGVRIGEALQVDWSQVNLARRQIRLEPEQTKNSEARVLPLPSVLVNMLKEAQPKTGMVFTGTNLRKEWMKACAAAGLGRIIKVKGKDDKYKGLTLHDLRRSAVRNLVQAGVPETVAMRISGHKTHECLTGTQSPAMPTCQKRWARLKPLRCRTARHLKASSVTVQ
jgi:integrase